MKLSCLRLPTIVVVAVAFTFPGANAWARPPLARPLPGVVQSIDRDARTLTVLPSKGKGPVVLVWKNDTRFLHNWRFTNAATLKEGTTAVVYYRAPLFGKPFATKVVWENGGR